VAVDGGGDAAVGDPGLVGADGDLRRGRPGRFQGPELTLLDRPLPGGPDPQAVLAPRLDPQRLAALAPDQPVAVLTQILPAHSKIKPWEKSFARVGWPTGLGPGSRAVIRRSRRRSRMRT